ncbi:unnamed protein product [Owenia fusiformis]|uniref:Profilin n=1 Tax=Owenia fusiformis TaxID=6347 RepID=A0A8S4N1S7_OWEFU|nr:unnamed protein product [Owenia fusiformis]
MDQRLHGEIITRKTMKNVQADLPKKPKEETTSTNNGAAFVTEYEIPDMNRENDFRYVQSWESYITDILLGSAIIDKAAIYDLEGFRLAATDNFFLSAEEFLDILDKFRWPDKAYKDGVTVFDKHYKVVMADGLHGILAKTGVPGLLQGLSLCKTRKLLVVAIHKDNNKLEKCNQVVMELGDFFIQKGL